MAVAWSTSWTTGATGPNDASPLTSTLMEAPLVRIAAAVTAPLLIRDAILGQAVVVLRARISL